MPFHSPLTTHRSRRGFTLIEMLVAMALTLILVYAIAHFYAIIGDAVKDGRAMIELNQQLKAVAERLKSDFEQVTVPVIPWADEGGAAGYLEIKEGPASDWDVNGNFKLDANYDIPNKLDIWPPSSLASPPGPDGIPDFELPNVTNLLGDTDDFIGMTIRAGALPFNGQNVAVNTATGLLAVPSPTNPPDKFGNVPSPLPTTAPYAEVVWWTSFSDMNSNRTWDLNEPRLVHRRQLLIRPDLNVIHSGDTNAPGPYFFRIPVLSGAQLNINKYIYLYDMFQYADISMRPAGVYAGHVYFVANSLADLCRRENRFMHVWSFFDTANAGNVPTNFPYALDLTPNYAGDLQPNLMPDNQASLALTQPRHGSRNTSSQYRWVLFDGGRKGEDVILSNCLAFDVRVYDPDAILRVSSVTADSAVQPGDAGYAYANANNYQTTHAPFPAIGTGAYVDLGYGFSLANSLPFLDNPHYIPASGLKNFNVLLGTTGSAFAPTLGSARIATLPTGFAELPQPIGASRFLPTPYQTTLGFTYDTWTLAYERDGLDQNGNGIIDEYSNGLDDNGIPGGPAINLLNGVDDISERETAPPYPYPLRGIQVRIRVYEPNTRQARQATVESDFIPE